MVTVDDDEALPEVHVVESVAVNDVPLKGEKLVDCEHPGVPAALDCRIEVIWLANACASVFCRICEDEKHPTGGAHTRVSRRYVPSGMFAGNPGGKVAQPCVSDGVPTHPAGVAETTVRDCTPPTHAPKLPY
jgi:hypothetical protein